MSNCTTNIGYLDLGKLKRGDSFMGFNFELLEDDNVTPIDITGSTFLMQLKASEKSPVSYEFSSANNNIQIISGKVTVMTLLPGFNLNPNIYIFDMVWTSSAGVKQTIFNGQIEIV